MLKTDTKSQKQNTSKKKSNILEKEVLVEYNYWSKYKYFKLLRLQPGLESRLVSVKIALFWNSKKNRRQWM